MWDGAATAADRLGAVASHVEPVSGPDLAARLSAAAPSATIVVTIGAGAVPATLAAAAANPKTEFLVVNAVRPAAAPGNVRTILFDEAEAGYLAGWLAAVATPLGPVGLVGASATEEETANVARGFRAGAGEGRSGAAAIVDYAGTPNAPDRGRSAVEALRRAGATAVAAPADLAGVGALRQACLRKLPAVALFSDAWLRYPELRPCLVGSVLERADVAVADSILSYAAGGDAAGTAFGDVASGWIGFSTLHGALPDGIDARVAELLTALRAGPPRPTPAPSPTPSPSPSPSPASPLPSPSGTPSPSGRRRRRNRGDPR